MALLNVLLTSCCADMTLDSNLIDLDMIAENVANFQNGALTHRITGGAR